MECLWNSGGKEWDYEYKYRRGKKTLCALYAREGCIGFMVIIGKAECEKFEELRQDFSAAVHQAAGLYDIFENAYNGKAYQQLGKEVAAWIGPNDIVLECACGTGEITRQIAEKCSELIATDYSAGMLRQTRRKV